MKPNQPLMSSGASRMKSRQNFSSSGARSIGHSIGPPKTVSTGCKRYSNDVTTPKLPPPPRTAQNRSAFSPALAVTKRPSASTMSTPIRLSMVRP